MYAFIKSQWRRKDHKNVFGSRVSYQLLKIEMWGVENVKNVDFKSNTHLTLGVSTAALYYIHSQERLHSETTLIKACDSHSSVYHTSIAQDIVIYIHVYILVNIIV